VREGCEECGGVGRGSKYQGDKELVPSDCQKSELPTRKKKSFRKWPGGKENREQRHLRSA
jgi:hypothetical protein